jgi:hypothetical protein
VPAVFFWFYRIKNLIYRTAIYFCDDLLFEKRNRPLLAGDLEKVAVKFRGEPAIVLDFLE